MSSPQHLATITLIIGSSVENVSIFTTTDLKSLAQSIVKKHHLLKDAIPFLESNIRSQLEKSLRKPLEKSLISEKSTVSHESSYISKPKSKPRDFHFELYRKGMDFLEKKREKEELLRKNQEILEEKELTFRPKTTSFYEKREKSSDIYEKGLKMVEIRKKSAEKLRNESLEKACSFHPKISAKTQEIIKKKTDFEPNFEKRLYKLKDIKTWREEKIKEMYPFKPNLDKSYRNRDHSPRNINASPRNINKSHRKNNKPDNFHINLDKTHKNLNKSNINLDKFQRNVSKSPGSRENSPLGLDPKPKIKKDRYFYQAKKREIEEMTSFSKSQRFF